MTYITQRLNISLSFCSACLQVQRSSRVLYLIIIALQLSQIDNHHMLIPGFEKGVLKHNGKVMYTFSMGLYT